MLTTLRNSSKNSILKIILGSLLTILIISFAMWGTEDLVGVTKKQSTVASVGNLDISSRETNYREHKSKIKNLINKIEGKENILTKKRIQDIIGFRNTLNSSDLLSNKKKLSRCF